MFGGLTWVNSLLEGEFWLMRSSDTFRSKIEIGSD